MLKVVGDLATAAPLSSNLGVFRCEDNGETMHVSATTYTWNGQNVTPHWLNPSCFRVRLSDTRVSTEDGKHKNTSRLFYYFYTDDAWNEIVQVSNLPGSLAKLGSLINEGKIEPFEVHALPGTEKQVRVFEDENYQTFYTLPFDPRTPGSGAIVIGGSVYFSVYTRPIETGYQSDESDDDDVIGIPSPDVIPGQKRPLTSDESSSGLTFPDSKRGKFL